VRLPIAAVTAAVFRSAVYVEITLVPFEKDSAPAYAMAHAEFKGYRPKQATFYVQPEADKGARRMKVNHRFQAIGDGFDGNCRE